ncbi:MAG TPA: AgmX/PglI C-terminal domain-containing protein [Polyangiaceae bacterium]
MAEARSTDDKPGAQSTKKAAKKAAPKEKEPPPKPAPDAGWFTGWRTWVVLGVVLVGGVAAWKILGSSYKGDIETICNSEAGSGFTMGKDTSKVTTYIRAHLATPEGNTFFSSLSDARLMDRANQLKLEAGKLHLGSCPLVASLERMAAEGEYRSDVQHLCSNITFPTLGQQEDAGRVQMLEDWIDKSAKSPRTKELGAALRQGGPADRATLLRTTAGSLDIFTCDLAKTLEGPLLPGKGKIPPTVQLFAEPQVVGDLPIQGLKAAVMTAVPSMTECYKAALKIKPDYEAKMPVKLKVGPDGKVISAGPGDSSPQDKPTQECIIDTVKAMEFPKNPGPLASILLPLELTQTGIPKTAPAASSSAPGGSAAPPPGSAHPPAPPASAPKH